MAIGLLIMLCVGTNGYAQKRKNLESKRENLLNEIRLTTKLLNETTRSRSATLDRYMALRNQVGKREELINTLQTEIVFVDSNIVRTGVVIESLQSDIQQLEKEYGLLARQAFRQKMTKAQLLFLFSAQNFNQAYQRWKYLRQYDKYRKNQARLILDTQAELSDKLQSLQINKEEKEELLASEQEQKDILEHELQVKGELLKNLKTDEQRLRKELRTQRKAHQKLNQAIEEVIQKEVAASRRQARSPQKQNTSPSRSPAKKQELTSNFSQNRGRLPWPVKSGVITRFFGKQAHPTLRKIEITNNGIDIRTDRKAKVSAVFEGVVASIQFIPGYDNMLIIKHGDYYTVYSNLGEVFVKKGQAVKTSQTIGRLSVNKQSNKSEVHFEVWRDKTRLNPVDWIGRK